MAAVEEVGVPITEVVIVETKPLVLILFLVLLLIIIVELLVVKVVVMAAAEAAEAAEPLVILVVAVDGIITMEDMVDWEGIVNIQVQHLL